MKNLPLVCRHCQLPLTDENWPKSFQKTGRRKCKKCLSDENTARYSRDLETSRAQKRAASKRRYKAHPRVIAGRRKPQLRDDIAADALAADEIGKCCKKCCAELTADNWPLSFRRRRVRRCSKCHAKLVMAYSDAHPDAGNERQRKWRERNPDAAKRRYWANVEANAERNRATLFRLKGRAILLMGGKCCCCDCDDIRVLHINHKNGRPEKEHKMGQGTYKAIIDGRRKTDDLDIRCANCNVIYEYERGNRKLPAGFDPHLSNYELIDGKLVAKP